MRGLMAPWLIPMRYIAATLIAGFVLPRLEQAFLPGWGHGMSVASAAGVLLRR